MARLLILDDTNSGREKLSQSLSEHHELVFAQNLKQAQEALQRYSINLVICSVHLVSENMFDFLRQLRNDERYSNMPFVCFRGEAQPLSMTLDDSLRIASQTLGANAFVIGDRVTADELREEIERCLVTASERRNRK